MDSADLGPAMAEANNRDRLSALEAKVEALTAALSTVRLEGERAGMERAAQWHDRQHEEMAGRPLHQWLSCHAEHAAAIRAEKDGLK